MVAVGAPALRAGERKLGAFHPAVSGSGADTTPDDGDPAGVKGRELMSTRTDTALTDGPKLPSIGSQINGWLFSRPRAWAWNLIAPPGVRRQARRDGYCAGLLLGEGYRNQRQTPWHHRDLRAWEAGLRDGAELAARRGHPDRMAVHMLPLLSRP